MKATTACFCLAVCLVAQCALAAADPYTPIIAASNRRREAAQQALADCRAKYDDLATRLKAIEEKLIEIATPPSDTQPAMLADQLRTLDAAFKQLDPGTFTSVEQYAQYDRMTDEPGPGPPPKLEIPGGGGSFSIPALLVIPGDVGFLKQFFSAQLFVANGAPVGSGLFVRDVTGTVNLPLGPDGVRGPDPDNCTDPQKPETCLNDDPLSLADLVRDGESAPHPQTLPVPRSAPTARRAPRTTRAT